MEQRLSQALVREPLTLDAVKAGALMAWPFLISTCATGLVMGVTYRGLGIGLGEAVLLSATIFSGTAQAVTAGMLVTTPLPIVAMLLAVVGINARYLVMSAHLRRLFPDIRLRVMLPSLFLLVDGAWMITTIKADEGRRDAGFIIGPSAVMYFGWVAGTAVGHTLNLAPSGAMAAAAAFLPLGFIIAMIPSQWKGRRTFLPWLITAAVALAAMLVVPATWATLIGAAAGTLVSALGDRT